MPLALLIEGVFHWGFSIRMVSESAAANPYPIPPPSTLIGALAYGYATTKREPECHEKGSFSTAAKVFDYVLWASFALKWSNGQCLTSCTDMIRMFSLIYQRGERHEWKYHDMWFGVRGHGKTYYPNGAFAAIYLLKDEAVKMLFNHEESLLKAAYSITRIGSKESLTSIVSAEISRDFRQVSPPLRTSFYFPARLVKAYDERYVISATLPILSREMYSLKRTPILPGAHEDYLIPVGNKEFWSPGEATIYELSEGAKAIEIKFNEHDVRLVVPSDVADKILRC
ncbi:MAG: type I-A CRISPR-associated protein Cas5a [Candidatus Nezhaarchaeales archaeon]